MLNDTDFALAQSYMTQPYNHDKDVIKYADTGSPSVLWSRWRCDHRHIRSIIQKRKLERKEVVAENATTAGDGKTCRGVRDVVLTCTTSDHV